MKTATTKDYLIYNKSSIHQISCTCSHGNKPTGRLEEKNTTQTSFFNFQGTESKQNTTSSLKEKNNGGSTCKQGRARGKKKIPVLTIPTSTP